MGVVVEATHAELGERVAIKVLHPRYCSNEEAMARFQHEAKAAVRIRGEHSVRHVDVGTTEGGAPFIVMELLEGADLAALLTVGAMPVHQAVLYILQACEGMAEVHKAGIIHRDLKPGNIFVAHRPDGSPLIKVLDFGIAKSTSPLEQQRQAVTMTLVALGTPLYMSPEQVRCSKYVDARTDVWSLGAILYELLAGRPAFGGNTVANVTAQVLEASPDSLITLRRDVPPELDRVVRKALHKKPEQRHPDMATFAQALAPFAGPDGRVHADRAARILRGEGRMTTSLISLPLANDGVVATTTLMESEVLTTHHFTRRRQRWLALGAIAAAVAGVLLALTALGRMRSTSAPLSQGRTGVATAARHRLELMAMQTRLAAAQESAAAVDVETLPSTEDPGDSGPSSRGTGRPGDPSTAAPPRGRPRGPSPAQDIDPLSTRK
jgi:serine/threonine-protein kinase